MKIFDEILKKNKASENVEKKVITIVDEINKKLIDEKIKAKAMLGGSVAKNTHLKHFDADVFVMFDLSYKNKSISDILEKILKKFKAIRVHGSRDYFQFKHKSISFEIIPVLDIKNVKNIVNITDMSPFHVDWVKKHSKYNDDIRLAKIFFKANGLYGAESFINGFSGYVLEILIIRYKGFLNLLKVAAKWNSKEVVDVENYFKGKDVLKILNKSKLESPLILIDPVQKERNAAAALNVDNYSKLIFLAKMFLESPSKDLFIKTKFDVKYIKKEAKDNDFECVILEAIPLKGKRDVVGTKILRVTNLIKKQIELHEFKVYDFGFNYEENKNATIWYLTYPKKLPKLRKQYGPKVYSDQKNIDSFIDKHNDIMLEGFSIVANVKRKYVDVKSLIKKVIKEDYVKGKVKKIIF